MKNFAKFAAVVLAALVVYACGNKADSPEAVAEKFLTHMNKKEYAEAKKLGTEVTATVLDQMAENDDGTEGVDVTIEDMKCIVTGENATCTYTIDGKEEVLNMVKQEDKWLADMQKEASMTETLDELGDELEESFDMEEDTTVVEEEIEVTEE